MKVERCVIDHTQIGQQFWRVNRQLKSDLVKVVVHADRSEPEPK